MSRKLIWFIAWFSLAYATPDIRLAVVPTTAVNATKKKLLCSPLSEDLSLCFRSVQAGKLRYAEPEDLNKWGMSLGDVQKVVAKDSAKKVNSEAH